MEQQLIAHLTATSVQLCLSIVAFEQRLAAKESALEQTKAEAVKWLERNKQLEAENEALKEEIFNLELRLGRSRKRKRYPQQQLKDQLGTLAETLAKI